MKEYKVTLSLETTTLANTAFEAIEKIKKNVKKTPIDIEECDIKVEKRSY